MGAKKKRIKDSQKDKKAVIQGALPHKGSHHGHDHEYEELKKFKTISEKAGHGIAMRAVSGEYIYVNDAYARMHGYTTEEMLGKGLPLTHTPDQIDYVEGLRKQQGDGYIAEITHKRRDGSFFPALVTGSIIKDEDGRPLYYSATVIDITEIKNTARALEDHKEELEMKNLELEEMNAALKVLLKKRDLDKLEVEDNLLTNVKELVMPNLERVKRLVSDKRQLAYLNILEGNLNNIISPFTRRLNSKYLSLSPTEIQVANLVKEGKTSKEIAGLMNLSSRTIEFHRDKIRKKIGIKNKKANLRSFLLSLQ